MKQIIYLIAVVISAYVVGLLLPWWGLIIPLGILGFAFDLKFRATFLWALLGVVLLWFALMMYKDSVNEGILSAQISELFQGIPVIVLAFIFSLYAGLVGALSAVLGRSVRRMVLREKIPVV